MVIEIFFQQASKAFLRSKSSFIDNTQLLIDNKIIFTLKTSHYIYTYLSNDHIVYNNDIIHYYFRKKPFAITVLNNQHSASLASKSFNQLLQICLQWNNWYSLWHRLEHYEPSKCCLLFNQTPSKSNYPKNPLSSGWWVGPSTGRSVIILKNARKLHFHTPIGALVPSILWKGVFQIFCFRHITLHDTIRFISCKPPPACWRANHALKRSQSVQSFLGDLLY